ncbi:MAG: hypothetical protein ABSA84_02445 [Gammaproteobacteria bacterium]
MSGHHKNKKRQLEQLLEDLAKIEIKIAEFKKTTKQLSEKIVQSKENKVGLLVATDDNLKELRQQTEDIRDNELILIIDRKNTVTLYGDESHIELQKQIESFVEHLTENCDDVIKDLGTLQEKCLKQLRIELDKPTTSSQSSFIVIEDSDQEQEMHAPAANVAYEYTAEDLILMFKCRLVDQFGGIMHEVPYHDGKPIYLLGAIDNIGQEKDPLISRLRGHYAEQPGSPGPYVIVIPCNLGANHWVGIMVEVDNNHKVVRAEYINSMGGEIPPTWQRQLEAVYPGIRLQQKHLLKQSDSTSCGVYTIENLLLSVINHQNSGNTGKPQDLELRAKQLKSLRQHQPRDYDKFYKSQRENKPISLAVNYANHGNNSSQQDPKKIKEISECLEKFRDKQIKTQILTAFSFQPEDGPNTHREYLNNIRRILEDIRFNLYDLENGSENDKNIFKRLIRVLFIANATQSINAHEIPSIILNGGFQALDEIRAIAEQNHQTNKRSRSPSPPPILSTSSQSSLSPKKSKHSDKPKDNDENSDSKKQDGGGCSIM